jgi:hypothetical protein
MRWRVPGSPPRPSSAGEEGGKEFRIRQTWSILHLLDQGLPTPLLGLVTIAQLS